MTMTTARDTEITLDPDVPLVRITRVFDAPRHKVFRAHTDPDLLVQWLGPRQHEMRIDYHDCRTGGSYPPDRHLAHRLLRGTGRLRILGDGGGRRPELRAPRRPPRRLSGSGP